MTQTENALAEIDPRPALRPAGASDESLVREALQGKEGAFEALVRRHQAGVFSFLCRMTGDADEAADVAQEVFLKSFSNLEQFSAAFRFKTWLYRIAANAAVDRRRRRRRALGLCSQPEASQEGPELHSREPRPDEILEARETRERLESAIGRMPASYREVLLLRFQGEMPYEEIASVTGHPIGTVKNRIFRAREILKRALA